MKEIRIVVTALQPYINLQSTDPPRLVNEQDNTFLGTGWAVGASGALSIMDGEKAIYTFAPGRWLSVREDGAG
jgi:hypothetical protein